MEISFEADIYPYGREQGSEGNGNSISIYIKPRMFGNVILSSLEGYFICKDNPLLETDCVDVMELRISLRRNQMEEFERKHDGKFFPFEK